MAVSEPIYQLTHTYMNQGQECNNVYFYQRGAASGNSAPDLTEHFEVSVLPLVQGVQQSGIVTTKLHAVNIFDSADVDEVLLNEAGTFSGAGELLASFVAAGFTLQREFATVGNGSKRVTAGGESVAEGNVWSNSGFLDALQDLADGMLLDFLSGIVVDFFPVVVKRVLDGTTYRLPSDLAEAVASGLENVIYDINPTSQTSRKIGRGS